MAEAELKKSVNVSQVEEVQVGSQGAKDASKLLSSFGGYAAIRGFLPDADNLNPAKKAAKNVFLADKRFAEKRKNLAQDIRAWLELLNEENYN